MFCCNNKRFTPEVKEDVLEWQHDFLKKQYSQLVEKRSSQVMRMSNGIEVPVDINQFMWSCLKMLHRHTQIELDNVVRRMVGDVKKYDLNPGLLHPKRHTKLAAAAATAATPAATAATAATTAAEAAATAATAEPAPTVAAAGALLAIPPKAPSLLFAALAAAVAPVPKPKPKHGKTVLKVFAKKKKGKQEPGKK